MDYFYTKDKSGEAQELLVTDTIINSSSSEINTALGEGLKCGTIIHTVGYAAIKEKGLDGNWTSV